MTTINKNRNFIVSARLTLFIIAISAIFSLSNYPCFAEETNNLAEGIKLFQSGNYDEALNEFKTEIELNEYCPLVYYYAALIRIAKEQYPRAMQNLMAALRDSSDFHDAHGLLALTYLKMGENAKALAEWDSFIKSVGAIEENIPLSIEDIMLPAEYHNILQREARIKELERFENERRELERVQEEKKTAISNENLKPDSIAVTEQQIPETIALNDQTTEIEAPVVDLEKRIKSSIRIGIFGIIIAIATIGIGIIGYVLLIRKRRVVKEEKKFSEEVEKILSKREFEIDEEKTLLEYEIKRRNLVQEIQSVDTQFIPQKNSTDELPIEEPKQSLQNKNFADSFGKPKITEEIKALVSRLYREGRSAEEIAHTSDLTKTEVDLILAVRGHHLDKLIDEINVEKEDFMDGNSLMTAIHDLSAEGFNNREIAKKLNISLSEVEFAASVMEKKLSR